MLSVQIVVTASLACIIALPSVSDHKVDPGQVF